jgi:hypothetical protein
LRERSKLGFRSVVDNLLGKTRDAVEPRLKIVVGADVPIHDGPEIETL